MLSPASTLLLLLRNGVPVFGRAGGVGETDLVVPLRQLKLRQSNYLALLSRCLTFLGGVSARHLPDALRPGHFLQTPWDTIKSNRHNALGLLSRCPIP
jgi:hypothetical protein